MGWLFLTHCYHPQCVTVQQDMDLQPSFDILARIVEQYESNGRSVRHVEATASEANGDTLRVTMDIPVALCSASGGLHPELTPETATLTDGGGLQVGFSSSVLAALPPTTAEAVSASNQAVRVADDSGLLLTVELTIDPNSGETQQATAGNEQSDTEPSAAKEDASSSTVQSAAAGRHDESESHSKLTNLAAVRDESLPAYEDTEYLQRLYDSCDTFAEMSQKIEMDVTAETVRRYMIETSIHDPTTYNTATVEEQADEHLSATAEGAGEMETDTTTDSETETTKPTPTQSPAAADNPGEATPNEQLVTDGIGLPEGLQIEDIMDAVVDSVTVHEVQQDLGLERQRTRELLEQLNLLDVVMRRIADNPEQDVSYEEIATRIRQRAVGGA